VTTIRAISYGPVDRTVDVGLGLKLLYMSNGDIRLAHDCKLLEGDERERVAPLLSPRSIFTPAPVTITPPFRCEDCGLHGWVIRGEWSPN
jgi:hypothetical protein